MRRVLVCLLLLGPVLFLAGEPEKPAPFPQPFNTEKGDPSPVSPQEALKRLRMPPGFQATLFASEPDIQQPIAITTDDRGRLWVAECYTYAESKTNYDKNLRDRVVILEDTDHDGKADKRTTFWDQANRLTSVAVGFGGVWVLNAPNLLFIPDADGDDKPDGPPVVHLDGFNDFSIRHNIVNGLKWGPDGWLYGRHGITTTSHVGKPGDDKEKRTPMNCGIWRYHPTRKVFEPVCWGTTNPWGHDWTEHGELFFINTVIGHLWHGIPGAHFKRMFGEDLNKHVYGLIDQHANHYHWDTGKNWTDSRDGKGKHGELGGGHAHSGCMIYQGDNWPGEYRGGLFTLNFHGRRLNHDKLVQQGAGYVGKHAPDMIFSDDPWFRGVELLQGNDGGVYIADWSDTGECHENDGVHRTSGRIFKVTFGTPKKPTVANVAKLSDAELVDLLTHANVWYSRAAQRVLQERHVGKTGGPTVDLLKDRFNKATDGLHRLRYLWALHACGGAPHSFLVDLLADPDEHIRVWAVRLLVDTPYGGVDLVQRFADLATKEKSNLVRLYLAASLQRFPPATRLILAKQLVTRAEDAADHNLPLMFWYGIEPSVMVVPNLAVDLAATSKVPLIRQYVARRITTEIDSKPGIANLLIGRMIDLPEKEALDVANGMSEALRGVRQVKTPGVWNHALTRFAKWESPQLKGRIRELGVVFGDGRALTELRGVLADPAQDGNARREALRVLVNVRDAETLPLLRKLVTDRGVAQDAIQGLASYEDKGESAELLVAKYRNIPAEARPNALATLTARPAWARVLLQAMADGKIPRADLNATQARQILSLKDAALEGELTRVWGAIRSTPEDKRKLIETARKMLTPERLKKADLVAGRLAYNQVCASCHRLYGQGKELGPDLTGSDRHNLNYLLENIFDPSALVPADFRVAVVALKSGRTLTGVVTEAGPKTLAVQTPTERVLVQKDEVEEVTTTQQSLMPDGVLTQLKEEQWLALFAYLQSRQQVPLPDDKP